MKRILGKARVHDTLLTSARRADAILFARNINLGAAKFLTKSGVSTKPMFLKAKSSVVGPIKGFIPRNAVFSGRELPAAQIKQINDHVESLIAEGRIYSRKLITSEGTVISKGNKVSITPIPKVTDQIVEVLVNAEGKPYTADVDLLTIGFPNRLLDFNYRYNLEFTNERGLQSRAQSDLIKLINAEFRAGKENSPELIRHAPESSNPNPNKVDYPIVAYFPNGMIFHIHQGPKANPHINLIHAFRFAQSQGYKVHVNPGWSWLKQEFTKLELDYKTPAIFREE